MKKETKTIAEYKAPRCKCVEVHVEGALLSDSNPFENVIKDEDEEL